MMTAKQKPWPICQIDPISSSPVPAHADLFNILEASESFETQNSLVSLFAVCPVRSRWVDKGHPGTPVVLSVANAAWLQGILVVSRLQTH